MEKCKEPAMVLSILNTIGLFVSVGYLYKQNEALKTQMEGLGTSSIACARKIQEIEKSEQNTRESLMSLNNKIKELGENIEELTCEDINNLEMDIREIIEVMGQNEMVVERPSVSTKRRSGDRRYQGTSRRQEEEKRYETQSRRTSRSTRERERETSQTPRREQIFEDEDDLVRQVRTKH